MKLKGTTDAQGHPIDHAAQGCPRTFHVELRLGNIRQLPDYEMGMNAPWKP
jgi:hypothetical protein